MKLYTITFLIILSIMSYLTYQRNKVWESPLTLYYDCVRKSPDKVRTNFNFGNALLKSNSYALLVPNSMNTQNAKPYILKAMSIMGDIDSSGTKMEYKAKLLNTYGIILWSESAFKEALANFKEGVVLSPYNGKIRDNLERAEAYMTIMELQRKGN